MISKDGDFDLMGCLYASYAGYKVEEKYLGYYQFLGHSQVSSHFNK